MVTGLVYDPRFLDHDTGPGHPECPERLSAIMKHLETRTWFPDLVQIAPGAADLRWIETTHDPAYIERARETCRLAPGYLDSPDVSISTDSFDIALLAAGGALALADGVMAGNISNGMGLVRPPGHHAERNMALGFCLFNNVAILARYLQQQYGLEKIAIVDWDVHHGNGTQHTFDADPSVLYVSLHQYPYYPGTGAASERGTGAGEGSTLNCPMPAGAKDADYEIAFNERILPKLQEFKPEALIISAGFDAHEMDPLAQVCLSTGFFGWMSERMLAVAEQQAGGRLISLLEGGYNLQALPLCVAEHLSVMAGAGQ